MQRISTTVIAIVGSEAQRCVKRLATASNVVAAVPESEAPPLQRAVTAWEEARKVHVPYLVHDADPLALVADAWVRRFDETGPAGELEVTVNETLARWRAGSLELPDYYIVLDADGLEPTRRHWYLGFLYAKRSRRVIPARRPENATAELTRLSAGPWWPNLDDLLEGVERVVPDRVGSPAERSSAAPMGRGS